MDIQINGITVLTLSDIDIAALDNDLLSKKDWFTAAIVGKINNCKKRMIREWQPILFSDPEVVSIPATDEGMIAMIIARDDYKTRIERETGQE